VDVAVEWLYPVTVIMLEGAEVLYMLEDSTVEDSTAEVLFAVLDVGYPVVVDDVIG